MRFLGKRGLGVALLAARVVDDDLHALLEACGRGGGGGGGIRNQRDRGPWFKGEVGENIR